MFVNHLRGNYLSLILLPKNYWPNFKAFIQGDLHIVIITNGKLNIRRVQPLESSVVDGSAHSSEVGTNVFEEE